MNPLPYIPRISATTFMLAAAIACGFVAGSLKNDRVWHEAIANGLIVEDPAQPRGYRWRDCREVIAEEESRLRGIGLPQ